MVQSVDWTQGAHVTAYGCGIWNALKIMNLKDEL
jgi:hypothetical protein